jgi:hypothetical protein
MISLLILLAQISIGKVPGLNPNSIAKTPDLNPKWVSKPVPHWSCPAGYTITPPENVLACRILAPVEERIEGYSGKNQEQIHWTWTKVVPADGILNIAFPPEFLRRPGCEIEDKSDKDNTMHFGPISKEGFTIYAKPKHELYLTCKGIIQRTGG